MSYIYLAVFHISALSPIKYRTGSVLGNIIPKIENNADVADKILVVKSLNVYATYSSLCGRSAYKFKNFCAYCVQILL